MDAADRRSPEPRRRTRIQAVPYTSHTQGPLGNTVPTAPCAYFPWAGGRSPEVRVRGSGPSPPEAWLPVTPTGYPFPSRLPERSRPSREADCLLSTLPIQHEPFDARIEAQVTLATRLCRIHEMAQESPAHHSTRYCHPRPPSSHRRAARHNGPLPPALPCLQLESALPITPTSQGRAQWQPRPSRASSSAILGNISA